MQTNAYLVADFTNGIVAHPAIKTKMGDPLPDLSYPAAYMTEAALSWCAANLTAVPVLDIVPFEKVLNIITQNKKNKKKADENSIVDADAASDDEEKEDEKDYAVMGFSPMKEIRYRQSSLTFASEADMLKYFVQTAIGF